MRARGALALAAAGLTLASCGNEVPKLKRDEPKNSIQAAAERPPIGPARTPEDAVRKLWAQIRHESLITAIYSYDSRLRREFPMTDLLAALKVVRTAFAGAPPHIRSVDLTPVGALVYTETKIDDRIVGFGSYLAKRGRRTWRITFDSTLHDALVNQVQQRVDRRRSATSSGVSAAAKRAGEAMSRRYLLLFAPKGRRGTRAAGSGQPGKK